MIGIRVVLKAKYKRFSSLDRVRVTLKDGLRRLKDVLRRLRLTLKDGLRRLKDRL